MYQEEDTKWINRFHTTGLFPNPLKTGFQRTFSEVPRGYRKRQMAWKGLTDVRVYTNLDDAPEVMLN